MRVVILLFALTLTSMTTNKGPIASDLVGAWESGNADKRVTKIYSQGYFSQAVYSESGKTFESTAGGTWKVEGGNMIETYELNTANPEKVGASDTYKLELTAKAMNLKGASTSTWTRIDDGTPGALAGAWLITGRVVNGEKTTRTPGPRKTMKILSGTRFQWIAYNVETKEFFGTGGGTYTTVDGKYTENISFFSRDNSRVGMSLSFEFGLEDGDWRHKGLSSKGDPIDEVWTRREKLDDMK